MNHEHEPNPLKPLLPEHSVSYWRDSTVQPDFPPLSESIRAEVAIVGAGIAGLTTAYVLAMDGVDVVLIEAADILSGTTGYTTAKITSQHNLIYDELISTFGEEKAKQYYLANEEALSFMRNLVTQHEIDCDWHEEDNVVYATTDEYTRKIEKEMKAYDKLGINGALLPELPLQLGAKSAIKMSGQARFHPLQYLNKLLDEAVRFGARVFTHTKAVDIDTDDEDKPKVKTAQGHTITCGNVVVATHYPFCDNLGMHFSRLHTERSYVVGVTTDTPYPGGMYISADQPKRSLRSTAYNGQQLIIVGGEGHKTGHETDTLKMYGALEQFAKEQFGDIAIPYRWSAQDVVTLDRVPYIGPITGKHPHVHIATGFHKWGMSNGTLSALLLRDMIAGRDNSYAELFAPSRFHAGSDIKTFVVQNADVAKNYVKGKMETINRDPGELQKCEGAVVTMNGKRAGAYKDENGNYHVVDTTCTHMGCELEWNNGERSWDCPCHGSRFSYTGDVIEGPATKALSKMDWPEDFEEIEIVSKNKPIR
ncbi:FAD-dependent oxidoreductase [Paenibacillus sambharensis]|uniref:FAD-dependent oxidoreductase n=1 Tax=Paenibacillus sambharensis TaxID=1803190 RepID=A0A2W1LD60_9BACL|nr:FAD-dependent oxidoreductase [Paenibacillus sambharensis]PZD96010.1 FAD-dependent oxidoreductase [Paenibacillus sambharensis]